MNENNINETLNEEIKNAILKELNRNIINEDNELS